MRHSTLQNGTDRYSNTHGKTDGQLGSSGGQLSELYLRHSSHCRYAGIGIGAGLIVLLDRVFGCVAPVIVGSSS
jgi:hypothetical protein